MFSRPVTQASTREPTMFESRVYQACSLIPEGRVSTYGILAQFLNSSPRAVGQALRRNPFAPEVPCHRVISAALSIGGFNGTWGTGSEVDHKRDMLLREHVAFNDDCRVSKAAVASLKELQQLYASSVQCTSAPGLQQHDAVAL